MSETPEERLEMLNAILTALALDDEKTIEKACYAIDTWIKYTDGVKGYCRT